MGLKKYYYNIITRSPKEPLGFLLYILLVLLSFIYLFIVKIRLRLYVSGIIRSYRLAATVISVGNITWGGTGKTPLVEYICGKLAIRKKQIVLLTRGYGADEDRLLSEKLPGVDVLAGTDRVKNAMRSGAGNNTLFVLDDGFQHLRIKRSLDIVTVNATEPFGNGRLIPAGILREPVSHIKRADVVVLTKTDQATDKRIEWIKRFLLERNNKLDIFESIHQPQDFLSNGVNRLPLDIIRSKKISLVSALADNLSFEKTLKNLGAGIRSKYFFMDHYNYRKPDIIKLIDDSLAHGIKTIVTTQKDWIKIRDLLGPIGADNVEFLVLNIRIRIKDEENFFRRVYSVVSG
jgi:tetraacyldisaccharide 4'-kinase